MATPRRRAQHQDDAGPPQGTKAIPKVSTGIAGLDEVLGGGLPAGRMTLLSGGPGSGKSLIGLQCLLQGADDGEPGIVVLFEERAAAVRQHARSMGWDLAALERTQKLYLVDARLKPEMVIAGDFSIKGLLAILEQQVKAIRARYIVVDAIDTLLDAYNNSHRERQELYMLHEWLLDRGLTTIMTVKTGAPGERLTPYAFLDFMADCVIHIDQRIVSQIATRRLRVIKYRGSGYGRNEYPFVIDGTGIHLIPITSNALRHRAPGPTMSTGLPELNGLLSGGYKRGTSILIGGTAGSGKTTLACIFAQAACQRGERVLYLDFEESPDSIISNMRSPGLALKPFVQNGRLAIQSYLPEAMGVEEHLLCALKALDEVAPQHLVVDAISACTRMGSDQAAFEYVMRILNACKERGITCLCLNQALGQDVAVEISGSGICSIIDTAILLRQSSIDGVMKRQVMVMKVRGAPHSEQFHEFKITNRGIHFVKAA